MPQTPLNISIIIPAYNEEKRISATLDAYASFFGAQYQDQVEILVVLNGCRDNTEDVVKAACLRHPIVRYINIPEPIGKGGAIIEGLKLVHGLLVSYVDADASVAPTMLSRLFQILEHIPTIDCVVASRFIPGSVLDGYDQGLVQRSRGFNWGVNSLFNLGIKDTQCGAKVFRGNLIDKIQSNLVIADMAFDVNFLVETKRQGGQILEIPINWAHDMNTTIKKPFRTSFYMALSVIRLRIMYSPLAKVMQYIEPLSRLIYLQGKKKL
jgi:glycosyltransferase involved in cell wall biosynthesis